jgi:hypothetical protein
MKPRKKARLQKKEDKFNDKGEAAFFAGKEVKARRNLKKALKVGNKLRGENFQPAMSDKEFRQRNRK